MPGVTDSFVVQGKSGWDINDDSEACSIETNFLSTLDVGVGSNIRIENKENGNFGAYTIQRDHTEDGGESWIRMGSLARDRLYSGAPADTFDANIVHRVPDASPQSDSEADSRGMARDVHYVSPYQKIVALGQHGGLVEHHTDEQAIKTGELLNCSYWYTQCYGGVNGAFDRWHITSTDLDPESWNGLDKVFDASPFESVISYQGFTDNTIIVGGRAPLELREDIRDAIDAIGTGFDVQVVGEGVDSGGFEDVDGDSADNIINRLSDDNGVQIEQPGDVRTNYWEEVAQATSKELYGYYL